MAICSNMAEPVFAFQLPEMDVLLKNQRKDQKMNQHAPSQTAWMLHQELVTQNFFWIENLTGDAIVNSSVMMIAIHTYIMFLSEPFKDMFLWWGQGKTRWD